MDWRERTKGLDVLAVGLAKLFRSLLSWLVAAALVGGFAGGVYYFFRADEELRYRVEQTLANRFPEHTVTVASAHFVHGEGIHLRGLSVLETDTQGNPRHAELTCKHAILHCKLSIEQMLREQLHITRVVLRGLSVHAVRDPTGQWNLAKLLPREVPRIPLPSLVIEDANVEIVDEQSQPYSTFSLNDLDVKLQPGRDRRNQLGWTFQVRCRSHHFSLAEIRRGWFDPGSREWHIESGGVTDLNLSPELLSAIPHGIRGTLSELGGLQARLQIEDFGAWKRPAENTPQFWIKARLSQGRFAHPKIPESIDEITIDAIRCSNYGPQAGWQMSQVDAKFGAAKVHLFHVTAPSLDSLEGLTANGKVEDFMLTRNFRELLAEKQQQTWDKYQPLGLVDASFHIVRENQRWKYYTDAALRDVSLLCTYFRYPVVHAAGRVSFRQDEKLVIDLEASIDGSGDRPPIKIEADVNAPGPDFHGTIDVRTNWLPLDQRMSQAMPGAAQKIVEDLMATGQIAFHAHLERQRNAPLTKQIAIEVNDVNMRYRAFPYPLQRVRGNILVTDDFWKIDGIEGQNDSCLVRCDGTWQPIGPPMANRPRQGELNLYFTAKDIPCDKELRDALPAGPQQLWKNLRPRGSIDLARIHLFHQTGLEKPRIDVLVEQQLRNATPDRRGLEILPTWFPLRMEQVTGTFDYKSDGSFQLRDLRAEHGSQQYPVVLQVTNADSTEGYLPGGSGVLRPDGSWDIQLHRILADGVEMTPEIVAALPASLASGLRRLQFTGRLSFQGQMRFTRNAGQDSKTQAAWSSRVNLDDGHLRVGNQAIHNVFGTVLVAGRSDGTGWESGGRVHLDSLNSHGVYFENVDSPWRMDANSLRFGARAAEGSGQPTGNTQHLTAKVFHGEMQADGDVGLTPDGPFRLDVALTDFDAGQMARDLAMPSNITGHGFARLQLNGNAEGTHTLGGRGTIELTDAKLARLPAIIELLNHLKVRNAPPDVFSSSKINFEISGPFFNLKQFDLHGESLSLKGEGWLALDRRLDITFYSILGGEKSWTQSLIPVLGQASQQLLQIRVQGHIDHPEWSRSVLPGLNEMFQEQPRTSDATRRRR